MMPLKNSKYPDDADVVLLQNVMKATGCTMDQAKALVMADGELDEECESALLNLSGKERAQEQAAASTGLCKPEGKHDKIVIITPSINNDIF